MHQWKQCHNKLMASEKLFPSEIEIFLFWCYQVLEEREQYDLRLDAITDAPKLTLKTTFREVDLCVAHALRTT